MRKLFALFKKDLRLYGRHFLSMLFLCALLCLGTGASLGAVLSSAFSEPTKAKLALVDKDGSALSQTAISAIAGSGDVSALFQMEYCDTDAAKSGIASGEYDAAILFEENYLSRILRGESSAVTILLSDRLLPAANVVEHFAVTGETLIKVAEYGVMSAWPPLRDTLPAATAQDAIDKLELRYAMRLLSLPENAFSVEVLPYSESGVGIAAHYVCAFLTFLLFLGEVLFFPYTARDCAPPMLRRIRSYGIGGGILTAEKAILPLFTRVLLCIAVTALSASVLPITLTPATLCSLSLCLLLISLFLSALSVLFSQSSLGISLLFALSVAGLFLGGGLLPPAMLPYAVTQFGSFTPSGLAARMLAPLYGGGFDLSALGILTAYTAVAFGAAVWQMRRICKKGGAA